MLQQHPQNIDTASNIGYSLLLLATSYNLKP
jgi:hypothetical protein